MQNVTIPSLATIRLGKAIIFSTSLLYISSSFDTTLLISHTSTPGRHSTVVTAMALIWSLRIWRMDLLGVASFELRDTRRAIPRTVRRAVQFVVLVRPSLEVCAFRRAADCVTPITLLSCRSSYTSFEPFVRLSCCNSRRVVVTPVVPFPVSCFVPRACARHVDKKQSKHHAHASRWAGT